MSSRKNLNLRYIDGKGYGMFASKIPYLQGDMVLTYEGIILPMEIAKNGIQINEVFGMEFKNNSLEYHVNHSCEPNCRLSMENGLPTLFSIKDIFMEEELTYNYNTVGFEFAPFTCKCKSKNCIGIVKGYKYLSDQKRAEIKYMLTPYLRSIKF
jgi:SET domain